MRKMDGQRFAFFCLTFVWLTFVWLTFVWLTSHFYLNLVRIHAPCPTGLKSNPCNASGATLTRRPRQRPRPGMCCGACFGASICIGLVV